MTELVYAFTPNKILSRGAMRILIGGQIIILLAVWMFSPFRFLPKPNEILRSFEFLWMQEGLGAELINSFILNLEALALASIISLLLAYSTRLPFFQPIVLLISKLRFLSLAGLTFFFTLVATTGFELKLYLLVFSITVFFVTGMADVIEQTPKERFDLARTLGMSEWRVIWEVVVLGQADKAMDQVRMNAAMGWMFLTMVEGMSRSGGGVGTLLLDNSKHFNLDAVFAIDICILLVGIAQDYAIGVFKNIACPYASMTLEHR